jgi:hypothetical protein
MTFTRGQVVHVNHPGLGYSYDGIVTERNEAGDYIVMDAGGWCDDFSPCYLTPAGWTAELDEVKP